MTKILTLFLALSLLFSASVAAEDEYKQVTINIPEHGITATFHAYTAFYPFYEQTPTEIIKLPKTKAFDLAWRDVNGFNYGVIIDPSGTKAVAVIEFNKELNSVDYYIVNEAGYTKWITRTELAVELMKLEMEWQ